MNKKESHFERYAKRIAEAPNYKKADVVVRNAINCLSLTNSDVEELKLMAWKRNPHAGSQEKRYKP